MQSSCSPAGSPHQTEGNEGQEDCPYGSRTEAVMGKGSDGLVNIRAEDRNIGRNPNKRNRTKIIQTGKEYQQHGIYQDSC